MWQHAPRFIVLPCRYGLDLRYRVVSGFRQIVHFGVRRSARPLLSESPGESMAHDDVMFITIFDGGTLAHSCEALRPAQAKVAVRLVVAPCLVLPCLVLYACYTFAQREVGQSCVLSTADDERRLGLTLMMMFITISARA